jgi:hypothetical protein
MESIRGEGWLQVAIFWLGVVILNVIMLNLAIGVLGDEMAKILET